jgi:CubicO group peptidase (beta-lactamase class C family)
MNSIENPSATTPLDFSKVSANAEFCYQAAGVESVANVFDHQIRRGLHPGAQLVVLQHGKIILDRHGGNTRFDHRVKLTSHTRFLTFSITKVATAACILKLQDQGLIDIDNPVAYYWPEFSAMGKANITVRQVLLHQSGLSNRTMLGQMLHITNWQKIVRDIAGQKPAFDPGSRSLYQILNFGFILGELVNRIAGIPIDQYLHEQFLSPMGLADTSMRYSHGDEQLHAEHSSRTLKTGIVIRAFNSERVRNALIPSASLYSTARDLAVFFQMLLNNGRYGNIQYLQVDTVTSATSLSFEGYDHSIGRIVRLGQGFFLGGEHQLHAALPDGMGKGSSTETFGHYGQRSSVVWADRRTQTVMAFLCNRTLSSFAYKSRLKELSDAVWDVVDSRR